MEKTLFNENGIPTAYIANDYQQIIYLWDGNAVAYVFEDEHIYGTNGHHLGWFVQDIVYNAFGERIGFTVKTCPVGIAKEPPRAKKFPRDEMRPRWRAPAFPNLTHRIAKQDLRDFLEEGQVKS
jgi:hypothetical protein